MLSQGRGSPTLITRSLSVPSLTSRVLSSPFDPQYLVLPVVLIKGIEIVEEVQLPGSCCGFFGIPGTARGE
jgi:hypothetical protein